MKNLPGKLYTARQVRELDHLAIHTFGILGFELMRRAGTATFLLIRKAYPEAQSVVAVCCGAGNNAGDGYIVATLAMAHYLKTAVYTVIDPETLKGDARTAYLNYREAGGTVNFYQPGQAITADIIVDALLGTGLDRPVTGIYAEIITGMNAASAARIAVDIPSGLNADTGTVMGLAVKAHQTITFIGLKQGLFTADAADYCGRISYAALDVPIEVFQQVPTQIIRVNPQPLAQRSRNSHKGNFGHVLIIGGACGYSGAVRLAGEAALRVGAGLVSIATRPEHAALLNLTRPELMGHAIADPEQLDSLLDNADVIVLGPGLGKSAWAKSLFNKVCGLTKPMVLDADALNLLADLPSNHDNWVLTPHPGEAGRLLKCPTAAVQVDRFQAAAELQRVYGGVAVLKGAGTIIATAEQLAVSSTGNPGMASGGMGDVLAGVIGGLMAQGLSPSQAAEQGVYRHGLAGDLAAADLGERGLLASDLMTYLHKLVNQ